MNPAGLTTQIFLPQTPGHHIKFIMRGANSAPAPPTITEPNKLTEVGGISLRLIPESQRLHASGIWGDLCSEGIA